ncbi:gag-pol polyprotein [Tanacetum coccineum]
MVSEKASIRHLIETTISFLLRVDVPSVFLGEAVLTAMYVINRISTAYNSSFSPFEWLYGTLPDYSSLRVFRCTCFVLKPHVEHTKLFFKSTLCVFLGYGVSQKGYRCYDPVSQKLYTHHDVDFLEHIPYYSVPASSHNLTQSELIKIDHFDDVAHEPLPILPPVITGPILEITLETTNTTLDTTSETTPKTTLETTPDTTPQTTTSTETVVDPPTSGRPKSNCKSKKRDDFVAMAEELAALHQNQTWDLVPLPVGKRAISSQYGMDYEETFALVAKMTTVRTLFAVASSRKWKISQLDVKNVFLNGDLNEELFDTTSWCLSQTKKKFESSNSKKSTLWISNMHHGLVLENSATVVTSHDDSVGIESLKLKLAHRFAIKDLGLLRYFLDKMVEDIPIDAKAKFTPTDGNPLPDPSLYRTLVEK